MADYLERHRCRGKDGVTRIEALARTRRMRYLVRLRATSNATSSMPSTTSACPRPSDQHPLRLRSGETHPPRHRVARRSGSPSSRAIHGSMSPNATASGPGMRRARLDGPPTRSSRHEPICPASRGCSHVFTCDGPTSCHDLPAIPSRNREANRPGDGRVDHEFRKAQAGETRSEDPHCVEAAFRGRCSTRIAEEGWAGVDGGRGR